MLMKKIKVNLKIFLTNVRRVITSFLFINIGGLIKNIPVFGLSQSLFANSSLELSCYGAPVNPKQSSSNNIYV